MRARSVCLHVVLIICLNYPVRGEAQASGEQKAPEGKGAPRVDRYGDPLPTRAVGRLGTTRFRHPDAVHFVGYASDGKLLVTADQGGVYLWDAQTGKEVRRLPSVRNWWVPLSGDGKMLLSREGEKWLVRDVATGKQVGGFAAQSEEVAPRLSHDGRLLLLWYYGQGESARLRSRVTLTGKALHEFGPAEGNTFSATALTHCGKMLLAAEQPRSVILQSGKPPVESQLRFLDLATGKEPRSLGVLLPWVMAVQVSPDDKVLTVATYEHPIRLLDAATGKELRRLEGKDAATGPRFSADGKSLFALLSPDSLAQWEVQTGKKVRQFSLTKVNDLRAWDVSLENCWALAPDGRTLAVAAGNTVVRYDVQTGKEIGEPEGHRKQIDSVAFGPQGRMLTGSEDGTLALWQADGQRLREFTTDRDGQRKEDRFFRWWEVPTFRVCGAFAPDGKTVAGLWRLGKLHIWESNIGKLLYRVGDGLGYAAFAYSPDGRFVAANGPRGAVQCWSTITGKEIRQFVWSPQFGAAPPREQESREDPERAESYPLAFSADGRLLLAGGPLRAGFDLKYLVRSWELASGQERWRLDIGRRVWADNRPGPFLPPPHLARSLDGVVVSFASSPDGRLFAAAGLSSIKLRDVQSGAEIRVFGGWRLTPSTAAFSPDGKHLLAGKQDGAIRVWDVATGTVLLDFPAHRGAVTALAFSPDGKLLASGARDTTVLLWEWDHVRRLATAPKSAALPAAPEVLWAELAKDDAVRAYRAMKTLASTPATTVAFLKPRLRPIPPVDKAQLERLLADLDHKQFATRQQAEQTLEKLGDLAMTAIRDKLAGSPSLEAGRRLERLLDRLEGMAAAPEVLQVLRAVEVLEWIGNAEARQILEGLARGAPGHRVTEEARRSVERLAKRVGLSP
ncbi:MAG TPA: hypothetical protein VEL76_13635 [Gemmataceae bacterium]|nr:hypothetical protein [Gemmataceae bacterium]